MASHTDPHLLSPSECHSPLRCRPHGVQGVEGQRGRVRRTEVLVGVVNQVLSCQENVVLSDKCWVVKEMLYCHASVVFLSLV